MFFMSKEIEKQNMQAIGSHSQFYGPSYRPPHTNQVNAHSQSFTRMVNEASHMPSYPFSAGSSASKDSFQS